MGRRALLAGERGRAKALGPSGTKLVTSMHLASVRKLMDGEKDTKQMPVQDEILSHVSTHLARCHRVVTGGGSPALWGEI